MLKISFNKNRNKSKEKLRIKINKLKLIKNIKLTVLVLVAVATVTEAISSSITYAKAGKYYDDLGTSKGIGSPILNENFTIENWNKWEMVCWGVFLSNFCTPLVDDYSSAFQETGTGSNGEGYKALAFGTGNDADNNQIIGDLCSYAIAQQKATPATVYVTYSFLKGNQIVESVDPNNCDGTDYIRIAKFQDIYFTKLTNSPLTYSTSVKDSVSSISTEASLILNDPSNGHNFGDFYNIENTTYAEAYAYLPTFWIKKTGTENQYVKIFDYTDSWDVQIANAIASDIASKNQNIITQFTDNFSSNWDNNTDIMFDCFGNLVTYDNKMIIPGSANQHLTKSRKINLLNSFVMNNSTVNSSEDKLVQYGSQYQDDFLNILETQRDNYPALSGKDSKLNEGACFMYYDIDSVFIKNSDMKYGEALSELFNQSIDNKLHDYPLHLEVIRKLNDNSIPWTLEKDVSGVKSRPLTYTQLVTCALANQLGNSTDAEILNSFYTLNGKANSILGDPVAILVGLKTDSKLDSDASITRGIMNLFYKIYTGKVTDSTYKKIDLATLKSELSKVQNVADLCQLFDDQGMWEQYKAYKSLSRKKYSYSRFTDIGGNETISSICSRVILAYPTSSTMNTVASIFGLREGSEFSTYSAYIYMTYLNWYGITTTTNLVGDSSNTSDFDTDIFNDNLEILKVDPSELTEIKSEAEMEDEVLRYAYLMLSPEAGRSYRTSISTNAISDFIYEHYQKICYGSSSNVNGVSTKNNNGFLNMSSVADNPLLSGIMSIYSKLAVTLIMLLVVATIIIGLLNGRKLTWFIATIFTIINVVLLLPSMGDLVPYIANRAVQSMFSSKMTFWSVSEAISNAKVEKDAVTQKGELQSLNSDDAQQIMYLVKNLNTLNLDKSLMIKKDISTKIIQKVDESFDSVQSLKSARWLLPLIMRQYSDEKENKDYLYTSLSDLFDDLSNEYWYYMPNDASTTSMVSPTMTSTDTEAKSFTESEGVDLETYFYSISSIYPDFVDTTQSDSMYDIKFKSYAYTEVSNQCEQVHRYSYLLKDTSLASMNDYITRNGYNGEETFTGYSEESKSQSNSFVTKATDIISIGNTYDRTDRDTVEQEYGYLWTTETPTHFFYQNIKESFGATTSFGKAIGDIQGKISQNKDGEDKRESFMHATEDYNGNTYATGYTRDVLDLEELFTNVIPYIYNVMLVTGGDDGDHGVLTTTQVNNLGQVEEVPLKIDDTYWEYEGVNQSWLFKSNWVVKLMECPEYTKPATVKSSDGTKYTIDNPIMPSMYPIERPMIFSEAQMRAYGLEESDLNVVELKCIKANQDTVDKWTLMLNYAGTDGMTLEILERQMAIDSTLIFCKTFSPSGIFNTTYKMYPSSLDLRNISFDSVMRMLMLNVSKDTSYIYGDTMLTVIENADIITGIVLLIVALICAYIIPILKMVMTALLTLLGFFSLLQNVTASTKYKYKVTGAALTCNILFLLMTLVYYLAFSVMISVTSSDEVLNTSPIDFESQSPMACLIFVLFISILYIIGMINEMNFVRRNASDMGSEVISYQLGQLKGAVGNVATSFKTTLTGHSSSPESSKGSADSVGSSIDASKHKGNSGDTTETTQTVERIIENTTTRIDSTNTEEVQVNASSYTSMDNTDTNSSYESINDQIHLGASMQSKLDKNEMMMYDDDLRLTSDKPVSHSPNNTNSNSGFLDE